MLSGSIWIKGLIRALFAVVIFCAAVSLIVQGALRLAKAHHADVRDVAAAQKVALPERRPLQS